MFKNSNFAKCLKIVTHLLPNNLRFFDTFLLRMYELISFVTRAKNRKLVLTNLIKPQTPSGLSIQLKLHRSAVSRAILELESKDLVKCLTPGEKMGRYYQITEKGRKILKEI